MGNKDLNRIKVVLAEKKHTNKWLAELLGKVPSRFPSGVLILSSPHWRHAFR